MAQQHMVRRGARCDVILLVDLDANLVVVAGRGGDKQKGLVPGHRITMVRYDVPGRLPVRIGDDHPASRTKAIVDTLCGGILFDYATFVCEDLITRPAGSSRAAVVPRYYGAQLYVDCQTQTIVAGPVKPGLFQHAG